MQIDSARAFFDALAARGREPRLADAVGTWELEVEGAGTWTVSSDRGALLVTEGKANGSATTHIKVTEEELLRLVRGTDHENLFMGLLRGAIEIRGEVAFAQKLQAILPVPEDWGAEA